MHLDQLLQRALAVSSLVLTAEALTFTSELIPRSDKLDTAPSKRWTSGVLEGRADAVSAGRNVSLRNWYNRTDLQWFTTLDIGGEDVTQQIKVALSTTSTSLLVPASNCTTCNPEAWKFGAANSTTFKPGDGKHVRYNFSTGPDTRPLAEPVGATCRWGNDSVGFGSLKVDSQAFLLCDEEDPILAEMPAGILGLDTYDPSAAEKTLLWNLWESGKLDNPVFSIFMPAGNIRGGQLTLGGLDPSKFTGDPHYMRLHMDSNGMTGGQWIVAEHAVYANGTQVMNSTTNLVPLSPGYAIFDMSTAFIQTPDNATAAALYSQISPDFQLIDPAGAWGVPCTEMAKFAVPLTFHLGEGLDGRNFTMPAQNFNLGPYATKPDYCQGVFNSPIAPVVAPDGKPVWILGSPFLKAYYSVWNGLDKKIGLATLVQTNLVPSPSQGSSTSP